MFFKKRVLTLLPIMAIILVLAACGNEDDSEELSSNEQPQEIESNEPIALSEALEQYSIWFEINTTDPTRKNAIGTVYAIDGDQITKYRKVSSVKLEDVIELSKEEIIEIAEEEAQSITTGEYALDLQLDEYGNDTSEMILSINNATNRFKFDWVSAYWESGHDNEEAFFREVEESGNKEIKGEDLITTKPIEDGEQYLRLGTVEVEQQIFESTFAGLIVGQSNDRYGSFLTIVDETFSGFKLDDPDTEHNKVTIEGK